MKRRTAQAKQRAARKSSKHVPQTSKYAEKKRRQVEQPAPFDQSTSWNAPGFVETFRVSK